MKALFPILLLVLTINIFAQEKCYIQVETLPGVKIFLDGEYKGSTKSEFNGLILENISSGKHTLRAELQNYNSQVKNISLRKGEVKRIIFNWESSQINVEQWGDTDAGSSKSQTGILLIRTLPIDCNISIEGMNLGNNNIKKMDNWKIELPIGIYNVKLTSQISVLSANVQISSNETKEIFGHFFNKEIIDKTEEKRMWELEKPKLLARAQRLKTSNPEQYISELIQGKYDDVLDDYFTNLNGRWRLYEFGGKSSCCPKKIKIVNGNAFVEDWGEPCGSGSNTISKEYMKPGNILFFVTTDHSGEWNNDGKSFEGMVRRYGKWEKVKLRYHLNWWNGYKAIYAIGYGVTRGFVKIE